MKNRKKERIKKVLFQLLNARDECKLTKSFFATTEDKQKYSFYVSVSTAETNEENFKSSFYYASV